MERRLRWVIPLSLLGLAPGLSGCCGFIVTSPRRIVPPATPAAPASQAPSPAPVAAVSASNGPTRPGHAASDLLTPVSAHDVKAITPVESGPGLLVCEPVAAGAGAATASFGAGCGRWLNFTVGANPELGKTPLWSAVGANASELGLHNLRLTAAPALRLGTSLGLTHVALGEVRGSGTRATLTYRILGVPGGKPVGTPLRVSGTRGAILAALPGMARDIALRLRVKQPRAAAKPTETPDELAVLGRLPWSPDELPRPQLDKLDKISRHSALAGLLFLINRAAIEDSGLMIDVVDLLITQQPENPLVLAQIGRSSADAQAGETSAYASRLPPLLAKYPNNALLNKAAMHAAREAGDFAKELEANRQTVRCSFRSPNLWLGLGESYYAQSHRIREGKTVDRLTPEQLAACQNLYQQWLKATEHGVELNRGSAHAWQQLSSAAAFAGDRKLAATAFEKALKLNPRSSEMYHWGLQLYQPKWYPNPAREAQLVRQAAAVAQKAGDGWTTAERLEVGLEATLGGQTDAARRMVRTSEESAKLDKLVQDVQAQRSTEQSAVPQ
jgi:tetratricopeptide (TPR) repeat protein